LIDRKNKYGSRFSFLGGWQEMLKSPGLLLDLDVELAQLTGAPHLFSGALSCGAKALLAAKEAAKVRGASGVPCQEARLGGDQFLFLGLPPDGRRAGFFAFSQVTTRPDHWGDVSAFDTQAQESKTNRFKSGALLLQRRAAFSKSLQRRV
jgi:hypothetical protein